MEYPYFNPTPQPYQFLGLPPTPAHTGSANSDDFSNSPSDDYTQFQSFDYNSYVPNGLPPAKQPTPPQQKPIITANNGFDMQLDSNAEERRGSNSDDEDMTPAQSRRKAQNRAAQRAFRERKERHVKDLEAKLATLEGQTNSLSSENNLLKQKLQEAETRNEILKATSSSNHSPPATGPLHYSPTEFYTDLLEKHENKTPSHRIVLAEDGGRLLAPGATWDFIINHPLFKAGRVDVGDVGERLKKCAKCDGQGPVFEERAILDAIEKSVASGSDELL